MRIALGADHRGVPYKVEMIRALADDGHDVVDLGAFSTDPVDYPDYARLVGVTVRDGLAEAGILICGSGAGVSIAANKIRGVRAALCHDLFTARQSREDDDANVLCLGTAVVSLESAIALARTFLAARFSHEERHARRLAKVLALEAADPPPLDASWATRRPDAVMETPVVREALDRLHALDAGARLWQKDARLWSESAIVQASVVNRLGWLDAPAAMTSVLGDLEAFAAEVRREGIAEAVLLGMGGSSLAADVFARTFGAAPGHPALSVLDTTDPDAIRAMRDRLPLARTLFLVSSKSGTTIETLALYRFFRTEVERAVAEPGRHFVAITDAGTPLDRLAAEQGFRRVFHNPSDIGGRYSALSYFGLVPAALLGVDVARLLGRARRMAAACAREVPTARNPALRLGAILGGFGRAGRDKVTLLISPSIGAFGAWLEQLLAESTGKDDRGLVAVHDEPLGPPEVYGSDRLFVSITTGGEAEIERGLARLEPVGHPVVRLSLADRSDLGGELFRWEMATAAAAVVLGVNPFDEPDVARAKGATRTALATFAERGRLPEWPVDEADDVARTLTLARPGDYVAVLAYLTPEPATTAALARFRLLLRDRTGLATTLAYGPRYLHSTGQLHKGGPPTPILVILTLQEQDDLPIPGERYGFATLGMAQALGDLSTLRAAHRRVSWLALPAPAAESIERLAGELERKISKTS